MASFAIIFLKKVLKKLSDEFIAVHCTFILAKLYAGQIRDDNATQII